MLAFAAVEKGVLQMNFLRTLIVAGGCCIATSVASETVVLEGQCRKLSDRGCTANDMPSYQAPPGMYIEPDSVSSGSIVSFNGIKPVCYAPKLDGRVGYTIPNTTATATFFTSFKAHVQVQSGSGWSNMNQVFKIKCKYSFVINKLP